MAVKWSVIFLVISFSRIIMPCIQKQTFLDCREDISSIITVPKMFPPCSEIWVRGDQGVRNPSSIPVVLRIQRETQFQLCEISDVFKIEMATETRICRPGLCDSSVKTTSAAVSTTSDATTRVSPVMTTSAAVSTTSDATTRVSPVTTTSAAVSTTSDATTRVSPVTTTSAAVSTTSDATTRVSPVTTTSAEVRSTTFDVTDKVSTSGTTPSHQVILWNIEGLEIAELTLVVVGFATVGVVIFCVCWRKRRLRSNPSVRDMEEERPVFPHPALEDSDLIHFDDETDPKLTPTPRSSSPIQSCEIPTSIDLVSDISVQSTVTHSSGHPDYTPSPIHTPETSESLDSTVISAATSLPKEQNRKSTRSPIQTRSRAKTHQGEEQ